MITAVWLIKKNGAWYRPNAIGYTDDIANAGLFTYQEAKGHAKVPGVKTVKIEDALNEIDRRREELNADIRRLDNFENQVLGLRPEHDE